MPPPAGGTSVKDLIRQEAASAGVPISLAMAVADQESSFNPTAMGPKLPSGEQAVGTFQLLPSAHPDVNVTDPRENIRGGIKYLRSLLDKHQGDLTAVLNEYGGVSKANTSNTYAQSVLGKLGQYQTPEGQPGPSLGRAPAPGTSRVATPPPVITPTRVDTQGRPLHPSSPNAPPASAEEFTRPLSTTELLARGPLGKAADVAKDTASAFDPRTRSGRRNLAGGVGGAVGAAFAPETGGLSIPVVGMAAPAILGAMTGGVAEEAGEQLAEHRSSASDIATAGLQQGAYEAAGQIIPWGVKAATRRVLAYPVSRNAAAALNTAREATTARLADALDTAQRAAGDVKAGAGRDVRFSRRDVAGRVVDAKQAAAKGVAAAETAGATDVQRAQDQAVAAEIAARKPFSDLVGQSPTAVTAGRQADAIIRGPAQQARDLAGQAVDKAAKEGPMIDLRPLKKEAQAVVDRISPPETSFPRKVGEGVDAQIRQQLEASTGKTIEQMRADPRYANVLAAAGVDTTPLSSAQAEVSRDMLKHPAMSVVNRILNAEDQVPFYDAHLWKVELQNALQGTADKAVKKQVTSITEHLTGQLRQALNVSPAYNDATAKYAAIIPLYTKEYAAAFRRTAATNPESLVKMIKADKPTSLRMLRDLLVQQSAEVGRGAEGQQAWDTVRGAWAHSNILNKGIEGIDGQLAKLPKEFADIYFGDANGQQVLQNLRQISSAYTAATGAGAAGIDAAKASAASGVDAARAAGQAGVAQTRQVGASAVEQTRSAAAGQTRQAGEDIRLARRAKADFKASRTTQERAFSASSLGGRQPTPEELAAHGIRAFGLGPFQLWGGLSWLKLLSGPQEKDLLDWAVYSPKNTQRLVNLMTGPSPTGLTISTLLRDSGVMSPKDDRSTIAQPPPVSKR